MAADSPTPTTLILLLPPPSPSPSLNLSPIQYVLALIALVSIPILIYLFLFAIRRPSYPTTIGSSLSSSTSSVVIQIKSSFTAGAGTTVSDDTKYYEVDTEEEEPDDHVCVVCLSGFDGREATKQLSMCKHAFHESCIDAWLDSNGNTCPICRASICHKKRVSKDPQPDPSEMV